MRIARSFLQVDVPGGLFSGDAHKPSLQFDALATDNQLGLAVG
jgi:hypothetical protein